jgi:hypothetical protein
MKLFVQIKGLTSVRLRVLNETDRALRNFSPAIGRVIGRQSNSAAARCNALAKIERGSNTQ